MLFAVSIPFYSNELALQVVGGVISRQTSKNVLLIIEHCQS